MPDLPSTVAAWRNGRPDVTWPVNDDRKPQQRARDHQRVENEAAIMRLLNPGVGRAMTWLRRPESIAAAVRRRSKRVLATSGDLRARPAAGAPPWLTAMTSSSHRGIRPGRGPPAD